MGGILIIDDTPQVIENFKLYGEFCGKDRNLRVYTAPTAQEGLECYELNSWDIEIVFLDYQFPPAPDGSEFNGDKIFARLKAMNPDVKVIMITGFEFETVVNVMKDTGILDVIPKPVELLDFKKLLMEHAPEVIE